MKKEPVVIPHALIVTPPLPSDYVKGTTRSIIPEIRVSNGDWTPYLPNYQPQKFKFDTNECSQLSGINCVETQCNYLRVSNRFPAKTLDWFKNYDFFDENGLFDFSERFTAILSGTSINGGSQWSFWTTISRYGLLPWNKLHYSMEDSQVWQTQEQMCLDYYNPEVITDLMRKLALESLNYVQIQYQWINGNPATTTSADVMVDALKQAPLHIGTPVCMDTWNSGVVLTCGRYDIAHATMMYKRFPDNWWGIRDHYLPKNKTLSPDYFIPLVTQGIISPVPEVKNGFKYEFKQNLSYGDMGEEVKKLQNALSILGYLEPRYITGNYLDRTSAAVLKFQIDHEVYWTWWLNLWRGHYFGPRTIEALNREIL